MSLLLQILSSFVLCLSLTAGLFSPDMEDYDAYGMKVAANNLMIVRANNVDKEFMVVFAPFTDDTDDIDDRICRVSYEDDSHYIYTVALGKNQSTYTFFFLGEVTDVYEYRLIANRTFVGWISYNDSLDTFDCYSYRDSDIQYVSHPYYHEEHLVMVTDPVGSVAYVFSNLFTLSYTAATKSLIVTETNQQSPTRRFVPFAVDYDGTSGIIAGYLENIENKCM